MGSCSSNKTQARWNVCLFHGLLCLECCTFHTVLKRNAKGNDMSTIRECIHICIWKEYYYDDEHLRFQQHALTVNYCPYCLFVVHFHALFTQPFPIESILVLGDVIQYEFPEQSNTMKKSFSSSISSVSLITPLNIVVCYLYCILVHMQSRSGSYLTFLFNLVSESQLAWFSGAYVWLHKD